MSKSVSRVRAALAAAGLPDTIREMPSETRTAAQAAAAVGCAVDQIAKSIVFAGLDTGRPLLFLTAGGRTVDAERAAGLAGERIGRADAALVREVTGFAIGGVSPLGHLSRIPSWFDRALLGFPLIWAAAGTPRHVFEIAPADLQRVSGAQVADFSAPSEKM